MGRTRVVLGLSALGAAAVFLGWPSSQDTARAPDRPESANRPPAAEPIPVERVEKRPAGELPEADQAPTSGTGEQLHGTLYGTVRYEDGSPAAGLRAHVSDSHVAVDNNGSFRRDGLRPGHYWLTLETMRLDEFELKPGEEHRVEAIIPRGTAVEGKVLTADGQPARCTVVVAGGPDDVHSCADTDEAGRFRIRWMPIGHSIVVYPSRFGRYPTAVVPIERALDKPLHITLAPSPPLPLRFENVPPEWKNHLPLVVWCYSDGGLLLTPPPTNSIGAAVSGNRATVLDKEGRPVNSIPTPAAGTYRLAVIDTRYGEHPWLEVPVEIGDHAPDEIVLRIPDGARVTVVARSELARLAIGPAIRFCSSDGLYRFPRVPAGAHAIWSVSRTAAVRVGEIQVPVDGGIRHELTVHDTPGTIEGLAHTLATVELRRAGDDAVVARKRPGTSLVFHFSPLHPGRYALVVGGQRIPLVLAPGQTLDVGYVEPR